MSRGELLIEVLSEEIPARMQRRGIEELVQHLGASLATHRISPTEPIRGFVTPRRLTAIAKGIPENLPEFIDERRGPRVGAPKQALEGFLRSLGLASVEQCEIRDTGRGEFYFATVRRPGRHAIEVLPDLVYSTLAGIAWPKAMHFPASHLRWVRPLTSVVCLFGGAIVKLPLGAVPSGRTTRGHRFLSPGEIAVENASDYVGKLEGAYVVLDQDRRRDLIKADLDRIAQIEGVGVTSDPGLLDEVTGLAEFPVVLMGRIDDASMQLPSEVLTTAMRTHQKYFTCLTPDGTPAPRFLFVANNLTPDGGKTIVAGNERVLKARLADARFFWDQDRKVPLASRVEALNSRVYHAKLGSMRDKVHRVEKLSVFLKRYVPGDWPVTLVRRAALLSKADLSTGMVGEFPELQGIMGRYYALSDNEDPRVADAIADHYKPLGPNDGCPIAPVSVVLALADKLDTLVSFFSVDERPTGSGDPYALRRAALGIIRIILERQLRVPLAAAFSKAAEGLGLPGVSALEITLELVSFVAERLKVHLRGRGTRHDLIAAAFARISEAGFEFTRTLDDDLVRLLNRVAALQVFLSAEDGASLLLAYRRASNIVGIEEKKGDWKLGQVDPSLLRQAEERRLYEALDRVEAGVTAATAGEHFTDAMSYLATLRGSIDEFFDKVTVNVDDKVLRENRLRLLSRIRAVMNQVADFSQIEG